ncbi:DUF2752 domain-containing protein [Rubinisphaera sp. ICM_H10]|nr:DUF2752 domain-containing protein [Rubinisphaera margarita]
MTTSFSWFVRGHLIESIQTNVAATFLAMTCVVLIPGFFLSSAGVIRPNRRALEKQTIVFLSIFILLAVVQWSVRFAGIS